MTDPLKLELQDLRILLVEDDEDCREFISLGLEMEGVTVVAVPDAEEAITTMAESFFDAVATDMKLPGMDGIGLLRHIRANVGDIPVIFITGYGSVGSAVDALKLGAQDYLSKPFKSVDDILSAIWRSVERHRLSIRNQALRERVARTEKLESLENLAAGVAHDLNNVLAPLVSLPDIMIEEIEELGTATGSDVDELRSDLLIMKAASIRAASVVRDLMASSRIGTMDRVPTDMNKLVCEWLVSQEANGIRESIEGLEIRSNLEIGPIRAAVSAMHVMRAISNLARNGFEAMDPGMTGAERAECVLTIGAENVNIVEPLIGYDVVAPGRYVRISVSDTGVGISDEDMHRIFEPFFTRKKECKRSGSGLGLAVVHGVMKGLDGFVDVRSDVGKGTTFDLYFPSANDDAAVHGEALVRLEGTEHILVVDDEPRQRKVVGRMLGKLGYKVSVAGSGQEALALVSDSAGKDEKAYELVVLDMIMAENFDGLDTFRAIREIYSDQKVVIASGFAPTGRIQAAIDMGAGWLQKPYVIEKLSAVLREQLDGA